MVEVTGGERLERTLSDIARLASNAKEVRVGFLADATYPDGKPVALIAAIQNWGAPSRGIPPRPFFSDMIQKRQHEWGPAIGNLLVKNGYDALRTLQLTGEAVAGQLRTSIVETNDPPLAPSTIRRKGFSKPLVDSGHMLNSVDYEVKAHE